MTIKTLWQTWKNWRAVRQYVDGGNDVMKIRQRDYMADLGRVEKGEHPLDVWLDRCPEAIEETHAAAEALGMFSSEFASKSGLSEEMIDCCSSVLVEHPEGMTAWECYAKTTERFGETPDKAGWLAFKRGSGLEKDTMVHPGPALRGVGTA